MAFLFTPRFNRFDVLVLAGIALMMEHGDWLTAILVALGASAVSVYAERALLGRAA